VLEAEPAEALTDFSCGVSGPPMRPGREAARAAEAVTS
jgi:hypothetical protein